MQRSVIILRGVSGAGKSSFAQIIANPCCICTADDYFMDKDGNYNFDPKKLGKAHEACYQKFEEAIKDPTINNIVVANTNTKSSDYKKYADTAKKYGIRVFQVILEKRHNNYNVHGVGYDVLKRQENNILSDIKLL